MSSWNECSESEKKIYSLLSLCKKAGKLAGGDLAVMDSIKSGKAQLVLIAEDASDNAKKKYRDKCEFRGIPWGIFGERASLGGAVGTGERAAVALTDAGFAETVKKRLATMQQKGESNGKD